MIDGLTAEQLLAMDEQGLFAALGRELLGQGQGFGSEDVSRARRYAKAWFEDKQDDLQQRVCGASSIKALVDQEPLALGAEVAALTPLLHVPVGSDTIAGIVAVLIARRGLRAFCADQE